MLLFQQFTVNLVPMVTCISMRSQIWMDTFFFNTIVQLLIAFYVNYLRCDLEYFRVGRQLRPNQTGRTLEMV